MSQIEGNARNKQQKVKFLDLAKEYQCGLDIVCRVTLTPDFKLKDSDQICLFRTQEVNPKGYYRPVRLILKLISDNVYRLTFPANAYTYCPGNHIFHYISENKEIVANSEAFTLIKSEEPEVDILSMSDASSITTTSIDQEELTRLRDENALLKESLKLFVNEKTPKNYDREFYELKSLVNSLRGEVHHDRHEINMLQRQVAICLQVNRDLLGVKLRLERKLQHSSMSSIPATSEDIDSLSEYDPGELEALPPLPFAK